ncbi:MAG TPA: FMN-binding negative transcriptional regulator [Hyphomicrobiaceae bacterium]|jgi:transcriptional regulator|nr:FMN-binding negative transcriptional regulator [Hyphomicrobiaceae bacterium]
MYVHPAFKVDDGEALAMLRDRAFGLLVVTTPAAPVAVHVPFLVDEQADSSLRVALHVARANALHSHIGQGSKALLVCAGPDAYISPDWYGVPNQVPTWTYTSVHLAGTVRLMPERGLLAHVDRLSAYFENRLLPKQPWSSAKMDEARRAAMLKAIVGIEMEVESIAAQNKLIQHKGQTEHCGAIAHLRQHGQAGSMRIAELMQEVARRKFGAEFPKQSVKQARHD